MHGMCGRCDLIFVGTANPSGVKGWTSAYCAEDENWQWCLFAGRYFFEDLQNVKTLGIIT